MRHQTLNRRLAKLLSDFGYRVDGRRIISVGVRGFTSDTYAGPCRDLFDAAERLRPVIRSDEYNDLLAHMTRPAD